MDTKQQWTAENPIGTPVRLKGTKTARKVASHAFEQTPRMPLVLLDDGLAVQIDWVERIMPDDNG